jgi:hypothetical protein
VGMDRLIVKNFPFESLGFGVGLNRQTDLVGR